LWRWYRLLHNPSTKDDEINLSQDLFTNENTDSKVKVHELHFANELLVRDRLSFKNLLQSRQRSKNNEKPSKTVFGYDQAWLEKLTNYLDTRVESVVAWRI